MHELSLAMNIVEIAEREAIRAGHEHFTEIVLEIGSQSGVELEALDLAVKSAFPGTVLADAKVVLNPIQARAKCRECDDIFEINQLYDACPHCGSFQSAIIEGKTMIVKSLTLE